MIRPALYLLATGVAMAAGAAVYSFLEKRTTPLLGPLTGEPPKVAWIRASDVRGTAADLPRQLADATLRVEITSAPYDPAEPDVWRGNATSATPPDGGIEVPLPNVVVAFDRHKILRSLYA